MTKTALLFLAHRTLLLHQDGAVISAPTEVLEWLVARGYAAARPEGGHTVTAQGVTAVLGRSRPPARSLGRHAQAS